MSSTAARDLARFIAAHTPAIAKESHAALATLRMLIPGATELVYDNYNALAIGFAPGEKASDIVISLALYPRWLTLFFMLDGPRITDPGARLDGSGKAIRSLRLAGAKTLDEPEVRAMIVQALSLAVRPIDPAAEARIVIKSISAKQRPRRPG